MQYSIRCLFALVALSVPGMIIGHSSQHLGGKHLVTLADLETVKSAFRTTLSPDGTMLLYEVADNGIWLVETRQGSKPERILTDDSHPPGVFPVWSPDSRSLAYASARSGQLQIWVLNTKDGRSKQVTTLSDGMDPTPYEPLNGSSSIAWSPDSSELVFASQVPIGESRSQQGQDEPSRRGPDAPLVLTTETPLRWTIDGLFSHGVKSYASVPLVRKASHLFIVSLKTAQLRQLTRGNSEFFAPSWSPDGKRIACVSTEGRGLQGFQGYPNIYMIDVETGRQRALTTELRDRWDPRWSPDGKYIAYWDGERVGRHGITIIDPETSTTLDVTREQGLEVGEFSWSSDSLSILFAYQKGVVRTYARAMLNGELFAQQDDGYSGFRWGLASSTTGAFAWVESNGSHEGEIEILPAGRKKPYVLVDLNPQIKDWELGSQEIVRWKNSRGDNREGILIKPVGYQVGRKYPLIVDGYPGMGNGFYSYPMGIGQGQAARGYAVFIANPRPPHFWMTYSKKEQEIVKGPKGWNVAVDDVMSGVDELIHRGIADPDRMGLDGFSNGGGVVNYLVTRTQRFKCAVSVAGVSPDWIRPFFLEMGEGGEGVPTFAGGITPWDDPLAYVELSAIFYLDKVTTPMLLADGDQDSGFILGMIEMYNGLRFLGKEVTLLRYPNQEHGFTGGAMRDFWERKNAFFDKYLKGPANK